MLAFGLIVIAAGCGESHPSTRPSEQQRAPGGLRPAAGYGSYDGCRSGCSGQVPAQLRRPLRLRPLARGRRCPLTLTRAGNGDFSIALGSGPIYAGAVISAGAKHDVGVQYLPPPAGSGRPYAGSRWGPFKVLWVSRPTYDGPVLIRGRQLDGPRPIGFGDALVPVAELQLPAGDRAGAPRSAHGWRNWPSTERLSAPGCYAWQVDGTKFSEVIVFRAVATR